uniref:Lipase_3 domain-containing protein n=1 Tax=Panagrellus redivivus TaxID=6233 RepID=A0A7E4VAH9_PANRE
MTSFVLFLSFLLTFLGMAAATVCSNLTTCQNCVTQSDCFFYVTENKCQSKSLFQENDYNLTAYVAREYECPRPGPTYSDDFSRNVAFVYAAASLGDKQQIQTCLKNRIPGAVLYKQYTVDCDLLGSTCSAYIALNGANQTITVVFRGSVGKKQIFAEFIELTVLKLKEKSDFFGGNVYHYFYTAYQLLWDAGLGKDLQELARKNPSYKLQVFGHSLGGSLASLTAFAAVKYSYFTSDKVLLYTFGQPRTGDIDYAAEHDRFVPNSFRIVHGLDFIAQVPFREDYNSTAAYHHRTPVFYGDDMGKGASFEVSPLPDPQYGYKYGDLLSHLHITYFNVDYHAFYLNGCVA